METLGADRIILDLANWWDRMTGPPLTSGMVAQGARHPFNKPNSWCPQLEDMQDQELPTSWQKMDQGLATREQGVMLNPNPERSEQRTVISKPIPEEDGALQTPGDALGARHPMNKPNSWSPQLEHGQDQSVRATWDKID